MSSYSLSVKPIEEYNSAVIAGIVRSISFAFFLGLVLVLPGCGQSFNFNGTWKGNRNLAVKPGENPFALKTMGQVTLIVDRIGFKLVEAGIPMEGTFRTENGKGYLKIESRLGTPITREPPEIQDQFKAEIVLTPRKDGKLDFFDPANTFFPEPVPLVRERE